MFRVSGLTCGTAMLSILSKSEHASLVQMLCTDQLKDVISSSNFVGGEVSMLYSWTHCSFINLSVKGYNVIDIHAMESFWGIFHLLRHHALRLVLSGLRHQTVESAQKERSSTLNLRTCDEEEVEYVQVRSLRIY